jgi:hypothetical protein
MFPTKPISDKEPPYKIVMKEVHGQLVPVKVFRPMWAEGSIKPDKPKAKQAKRKHGHAPKHIRA